jgi:hypothetical protein
MLQLEDRALIHRLRILGVFISATLADVSGFLRLVDVVCDLLAALLEKF